MIDGMKLRDALTLIGRTRVLAGLNHNELALFGEALEGIRFDAGTVLMSEGQQPTTGLNVVLSGAVEVFLPGAAESPQARRTNKVALATLKTGDCFGEYAIFDDKPASASVVGMRPGQAVCIAKDTFRAVLDQHDAVAKKVYRNLLQIMVERLRDADQDFDVLLGKTA